MSWSVWVSEGQRQLHESDLGGSDGGMRVGEEGREL